MQVSTGFTIQTPDGNWRKVSVSIGRGDLLRLAANGKIDGFELASVSDILDEYGKGRLIICREGVPEEEMSLLDEFKIQQATADKFLIYQLAREHFLTPQEAKERMQEFGY